MEVVYGRCAGLDVHKETVVACVLIREGNKVQKEIRTFRTMTADLLVLHDWLMAHGVTHVAMESSGIYWKPIFNLLEGSFTVLLVNAAHIKNVPGRKTDVKDCEWIADLLSHGLLKGSFIPPEPLRDLRDLTRYRKSLTDERVREVNRLQKLLETASVRERLVRLLPMLNREHEVLNLSSKIQTDVATSIAKTQRDFFLREQLRAIQRELGEGEPNAGEIKLLREKIEGTPMPAEAKKVATQELVRLQQTPRSGAEYGV